MRYTRQTMRTLYHLRYSPFSRRTRLALAYKGLDCELREAGENPAWREEARGIVPFRTLPVLVDDGRAMADSGAIAHWLDRAYPEAPRLWPEGDGGLDALQTATLVDVTLNIVVDLGTRYYPLRENPAWADVKHEMMGRAQHALNALSERVASSGRSTVCPGGWCAADMWIYTLVAWFQGMPARSSTTPRIAQVLTLGLEIPPTLVRWADAHRNRDDVRALG
jgi:glutathione S-transferase